MVKTKFTLPLFASLALLFGCSGDDKSDPDEQVPVTKTHAVFSPATSELPIPNDLLFGREPLADGTMFAGYDPTNPVITGIDYLDGNSVVAPIDITFTAPLDTNQILDGNSFVAIEGSVLPNPNQNVFLLPLSYPSGDALSQAEVEGVSVEIPTFADAVTYQTAAATGDVATLAAMAEPTVRVEVLSLDGGIDNTLRIYPLKPLMPETKYLIVLTGMDDWAGNPVYSSIAYDYIKNPESNLGSLGLDPVRAAIQGWERLAAGYFGFKSAVYTAAGVPVAVPAQEDIIFSLTFTTAGTDATLKSVAAPEIFFEKSLRTGYKQDAISKLAGGTYNVNGDNSGLTTVTDGAINSTIAFLLTSPTLPDTSPNPLYSAAIAGAINAGADYATIAADATAAHIMQRAAAEAAISVHDSGDAGSGDKEPYVTIAAEAAGTVQAMAAGAGVPVSTLFPVPAPRDASFYRVDLASSVNPALVAPAMVYQGQITLPVYQTPPTASDGTNLVTATWEANETIGAVLDAALGNTPGTTPPSEMITYRYPFPTPKGVATVPLLATLPEPTTLSSFGITKPEAGWPVVIFVHGITTDRSTSLPMADALAFACVKQDLSGPSGAPCFATIALDQPLHGFEPAGSTVPGLTSVNDPDAPIVPNLPGAEPAADLTERHFNFTADAANRPIPMDYGTDFGTSGSLFVNLSHFANGRDTMRQMVMDLLNLNASLATMDVDGDGMANDLDTSRVYLIGHSLGGIDGLTFVAVNNTAAVQASPFSALPKVQAASTMFAGGSVTRLLTNSQSFAPRILPGLAAASSELTQGKSGLESYLNVFQGVFDSTDPINFAALLSPEASDTGLLMSLMKGNSAAGIPSDLVIPNAADTLWGDDNGPLNTVTSEGFVINGFPAPFAGSEPLIDLAGATKTADAVASADPAVLITRYIEGSHTTPVTGGNTELDPFTSAAAFYELVNQTVTFFALNGVVPGSIVGNAEVIEP